MLTEFYIIVLISLSRAISVNDDSTLGDEEKFGFILRFISTFILLLIVFIVSLLFGKAAIVIQIFGSLFIFIFGIPISIFVLKKILQKD